MRLLLTADLHFRTDWFRWLMEQAPSYDLVCIAGDLLDMFNVELPKRQAREVSMLIRQLADIVPVAICSGNHDNAGGLVSHDRASLYQWFIELGTHPKVVTDGTTRKLENIIITTIPYHCSKKEKSIWLDRGSTIRRQTGKAWMVLHHVPPKNGLRVSGEEAEAADLLSAYRPDYFVSGHDHSFPYVSGQSWRQNICGLCVLVPGQLPSAPYPNYIKLDTLSGESSWHTDRETGMSEDERLDHLLLKFTRE
jgi:DNA repair exonuclease SbcCD nuclease subunit